MRFYNTVLPILKRYYAQLCHCLPQNYLKTIDNLKQLYPGADDRLDLLETLPSIKLINETIVGIVLVSVMENANVFVFCDVMEKLCKEVSKNLIEALRNGL